MQGADSEKLALLRQLSGTDFLCAAWHKVPSNFTIHNTDGSSIRGVAEVSMLSDQTYHSTLFNPLMEELAKSIPEQVKSINGEYVKFSLKLPESPLCVTTIVIENEDGNLVPMLS